MIPVSKPYIKGNELEYVTKAVQDGWLSFKGEFVKEFEQKWAEYIGTKYAVATTSGTTALTLACAAINLRPGDEVIVPEFTMIATAFAPVYHFANVSLVDCGDDLNIDVSKIERAITPRTKAIMPVHIYGRPADMKTIMDIAFKYNLYVIEDAAEAHGAIIDGKKVGSWGDMGCFSFFANKILTTGEGGMVTTNDERLYKQLKHLNRMAFDENHSFLHPKKAYNFVMTNLQAGVGLAQLEKIDEILEKREQICKWYDEVLKEYTIPRPEGSVLWMYDLVLPEGFKNSEFCEALKKEGIEARVFFKPMGLQPPFGGKWYQLNANKYSERGVYLPTYPDLTKEEVDFVGKKVVDLLKK